MMSATAVLFVITCTARKKGGVAKKKKNNKKQLWERLIIRQCIQDSPSVY